MGDFDFPGFLYLNMTFFHRLFPPKHPKSTSKFMNIAKHFFKFNRKNHVCLVQYCPPGGHSSEHYHSLDEYIGCIAGSVNIRLALAGNPTDKTNIFLKAGGVVHILPETLHFLSSEEGSVTIPIKQTIKGKKDHFYQKP